MISWEKLVEFLVSTIGQPVVDSWRSSNNVDSYFSELRAALPEARLLIERSEFWRLPIYDPIDKLLYQLKDSMYEAESIVDELEYERLKNKVEKSFPGISKILTNWMRDFSAKVKGVHDRLNKVYNEMKKVCDRHGIPENPNQFSPTARPITSTFLEISNVWGRDTEFNEVIRLMGVPCSRSGKRKRAKRVSMHNSDIGESSSRMDKKGNVSVLSLVGMGGIGKTTLAQKVCNDKSVKSYFNNLIMWMCVSDNFDSVRLTKEMIESATKKKCNLTNFNKMQLVLEGALKSKKFLLVLDDVWSKDWQHILAPMKEASEGSVVLVTTRSPACVEISGESIGSRGIINLEGLKEHIYWDFFKSCAFDPVAESDNINTEMEVIGNKIDGLPKNIGNLKHLQFLDISGTNVKRLPKSICNLYNLQYLNMMNCRKIELFPEEFDDLVNLECFENIVKAIQSNYLRVKLLGNKEIEMFKNFCQLSGYVYLEDLQEVPSKKAAQEAQLNNKPFINRLKLGWHIFGDNHNEVLDGLCHHKDLKELSIFCYGHKNLSPSWLTEEFLPNLTKVEFHHCWTRPSIFGAASTISHLPRSITKLVIANCDKLENLQNLLEPRHLPELKHIELTNCDQLKSLSVELFGGFELLEQLTIDRCSSIRNPNAMVLPPSVKGIKLRSCGDLENSIPSCLKNLTSLETLIIQCCYRLASIPSEVTSNLKSLSKLHLERCDKLQSVGGLQFLESLQEVDIKDCPKLDETRGQDINGKLPSELLGDGNRRKRRARIGSSSREC